MAKKWQCVIGIDEVGRGPLAGPVAVCALILKRPLPKHFERIWQGQSLTFDSKSLTEKAREKWYELICVEQKAGTLDFAVCFSSEKIIDKQGIQFAIKRALNQTLKNIDANLNTEIRLDGGLKAPKEFKKQRTIIKGDYKEVVIGLASIVAKVRRDSLMKKLAKKYPEYGFERHKGYGTRLHISAIKKHKLCPIHRLSFLKKLVK